jgi:hypothetical protein
MTRARRALAAVALAAGVTAQLPPGIGQWEPVPVNPQSGSMGPSGAFAHKPAVDAGCYISVGADPRAPAGTNTSAAFQYDPTTQFWSIYPPAPPGDYMGALFTFGGYVMGLSPDFASVAFVSTDGYGVPGAGWQVVPLQGAITRRFHARATVFGGILYLFGGSSVPFNISVGQVFNDLWALDLNDVIATSFVPGRPAGGWVQAIANGTAGMPRARAGHVMVTYGACGSGGHAPLRNRPCCSCRTRAQRALAASRPLGARLPCPAPPPHHRTHFVLQAITSGSTAASSRRPLALLHQTTCGCLRPATIGTPATSRRATRSSRPPCSRSCPRRASSPRVPRPRTPVAARPP